MRAQFYLPPLDLVWALCATSLGDPLKYRLPLYTTSIVSRFGLAVLAGKQKDLGSIPLRLSSLFKSCGL